MSTEIKVYDKTGITNQYMTVTQFYGGNDKGLCIQLTQGLGGQDTPGYVQLTGDDALFLIGELSTWWVKNHRRENDG